jgi:FdhD protein
VSDRPRIGVSACLLGERVRYDGRDKRDAWLVEVLGSRVEWVSVCPEVEAGLGTPREPMNLRRDGRRVVLVTDRLREDLTSTMAEFSARRVEALVGADLDGYVLKAGSPSCGLDVPVDGGRERVPGLFAAALTSRLSAIPIVDERQLADPATRDRFVDEAFTHYRRRAPVQAPLRQDHVAANSAERQVDVIRVRGGAKTPDRDRVAAEEPLEIRLHGRPFAVIMRTPGADRELAAGFLLAERVLHGADDLGTIAYCHETGGAGATDRTGMLENVVNVTLVGAAEASLERFLAGRRQVTTTSACGMCGRRTIESLASEAAPIAAQWAVDPKVIAALPAQLRARQSVFDGTGGLHAAGLFSPDGTLVDVAEDVGRHNAVDKIIGRGLMQDALPLSDCILCVSGRTSFEIVQKAICGGVPMVAAVSAPSTLAIGLAEAFGVTLIGFVRGDAFNVYAHGGRVTS